MIIGSGLVGLGCGLPASLEQKKEITRLWRWRRGSLPIQLDEKGAAEYQKRFEKAGCRFCLGRKGADTVTNEKGEITHVVLDNGEKLECDMVIVAAGVRSAVAGFEDSGLVIDRGIKVNDYMQTSGTGRVRGGRRDGPFRHLAQRSETGQDRRPRIWSLEISLCMWDRFAAKNTINFFGLVSLCVGALNPEEGDLVIAKESRDQYERAIFRNHRLVGFLQQGDISPRWYLPVSDQK